MPALPPHISRLHAVFVQWLPYLEIHSACGSSWIHSLLACGLRAEGMGAFSSGPTTAPPGLTSEMDNRGMNGDSPDSRFGVMPKCGVRIDLYNETILYTMEANL